MQVIFRMCRNCSARLSAIPPVFLQITSATTTIDVVARFVLHWRSASLSSLITKLSIGDWDFVATTVGYCSTNQNRGNGSRSGSARREDGPLLSSVSLWSLTPNFVLQYNLESSQDSRGGGCRLSMGIRPGTCSRTMENTLSRTESGSKILQTYLKNIPNFPSCYKLTESQTTHVLSE